MADKMPNYKLEQERIKAKIISIEANVQREQLEIAEMHVRAGTYLEGIEKSAAGIEELGAKVDQEENELARQRLQLERTRERQRLVQQRLGILEMADRITRYEGNVIASEKAISHERENLSLLEKEHGKITDADFDKALQKLIG